MLTHFTLAVRSSFGTFGDLLFAFHSLLLIFNGDINRPQHGSDCVHSKLPRLRCTRRGLELLHLHHCLLTYDPSLFTSLQGRAISVQSHYGLCVSGYIGSLSVSVKCTAEALFLWSLYMACISIKINSGPFYTSVYLGAGGGGGQGGTFCLFVQSC